MVPMVPMAESPMNVLSTVKWVLFLTEGKWKPMAGPWHINSDFVLNPKTTTRFIAIAEMVNSYSFIHVIIFYNFPMVLMAEPLTILTFTWTPCFLGCSSWNLKSHFLLTWSRLATIIQLLSLMTMTAIVNPHFSQTFWNTHLPQQPYRNITTLHSQT